MKHAIVKRTPGQSLVELALILPIMLVLALGIIELGYVVFVYVEAQNAAREGARAAAVRPCFTSADITAINTATRARLPALIKSTDIVPTVSPNTKQSFGTPVTVSFTYSFAPLDPLTSRAIPSITIQASATRSITTGC